MESAVALAAIAGLLVLVIGGSELIKKAKASSILRDIKRFSEAVNTFEIKYKSLPGDAVDISSIEGLADADKGNGNGSVDSSEALLFWKHLAAANILDGKYDGESAYLPGVGIPKGPIEGSGYYIVDTNNDTSIDPEAIVIGIGGVVSGDSPSTSIGVIAPKAARSIDETMDDGKPLTGNVRGENGVGGTCLSGEKYNVANKSNDCILRFITHTQHAVKNQEAISGVCSQAGQSRETPNPERRCPVGYTGKIIETCHIPANETIGSWEEEEQLCQQVTCPGKKFYGERRVLNCSNGQVGKGIVEECSQYGTWQEIEDASDCTTPSGLGGISCTTLNEARTPQACSWGRTGNVLQTCKLPDSGNTNFWTTDTNGDQCALVTCNGETLGTVRARGTEECGENYLGVDADHGQYAISEMCTMDGTWQVVANECSPQYGSCTVGEENRDIGCPAGERGQHIQTCINSSAGGYWTTTEDTCAPITCTGEAVGTLRILENTPCSAGRQGTMMEVCHDDGTWVQTDANCTRVLCKGSNNTDGNANWPNANAGTNNVTANSCQTLYRKEPYVGGALPTRNCSAGGAWQSVNNPCVKITCAPEVSDNAIYPANGTDVTESGPDAVTGVCIFGYETPGNDPTTKKCSPTGNVDSDGNGVWEDVTNACVTSDFTGIPQEGLQVWLDADEYTSMVKNLDCANDPPGSDQLLQGAEEVKCWYDKSSNRYRFVAPDDNRPTYQPTSDRGVIRFSNNQYFGLDNPIEAEDDTTIFIVTKRADVGNETNALFRWHPTNELEYSFSFLGANPNYIHHGYIYDADGVVVLNKAGIDTDKFYIYALNGQGAEANWWINGSLNYTSYGESVNSVGAAQLVIGGNDSSEQYYTGDLAEIIFYNRSLSAPEITAVSEYLGNKWEITLASSPTGGVTKGLSLWLDALDDATLYSDQACTNTIGGPGEEVGCWKDKSIHYRKAIGAESMPPTVEFDLHTNRQDACCVVSFDNDRLLIDRLLSISETSFSMFAAFSIEGSVLTDPSPILSQYTSNSGYRYVMGYSGNMMYTDSFPPSGSTGLSGTSMNTQETVIGTWLASQDDYNFYVNGSQTLTSPPSITYSGGGTDNEVYIGGKSTLDNNLHAYIGEILLYNRPVDSTERAAIEAGLALKWAVEAGCTTDPNMTNTTGLQVWYDAKDIDCNTNSADEPADGSSLTTWADKSGNARNATAIDNLPGYDSNGLGAGLPAIEFTNSEGYNVPQFDLGTSFTVATVFKSPQVSQMPIWGTHTDNINLTRFTLQTASSQVVGKINKASDDEEVLGSYTAGETTIAIYVYEGSNRSYMVVNGSQMGEAAADLAESIALPRYLAANPDMTAERYTGHIAETLVYNRALPANERMELESYLGQKWQVEVNTCIADTTLPTTTNLRLWLDATDTDCDGDPLNEPENNSSLTEWKDKKALANVPAYNATVGAGSTAPQYKVGIKSGNSVVRFTGASVYMTTPEIAIPEDDSFSIITLFETTTSSSTYILGSDVDTGIYPLIWTGTGDFLGAISGSVITSNNAATSEFHIGTFIYDAAGLGAATVYVDGQAGTSGIAQASLSTNALRIGGAAGFSSFEGDIGEILIYGGAISENTRGEIESYLASKWGIALACVDDSSLPLQTSNLRMWLDATDIDCDGNSANNPINGQEVTIWRDKSFSQQNSLTSVSPPTFSDNTYYPDMPRTTVSFDNNSLMTLSPRESIIGPHTVAIVMSPGENTATSTLIDTATGGGADKAFKLQFNRFSGMEIQGFLGNGSSWTATPIFMDDSFVSESNPYLIMFKTLSPAYQTEVLGNGKRYYGEDPGGFNAILMSFGATFELGNGATEPFNGDISELIIYNSALSLGDYNNLKNYLTNKWQIPNPGFNIQSDGSFALNKASNVYAKFVCNCSNSVQPDAVGWYPISIDGVPGPPHILYYDTAIESAGGEMLIGSFASGVKLGFFIIPNIGNSGYAMCPTPTFSSDYTHYGVIDNFMCVTNIQYALHGNPAYNSSDNDYNLIANEMMYNPLQRAYTFGAVRATYNSTTLGYTIGMDNFMSNLDYNDAVFDVYLAP